VTKPAAHVIVAAMLAVMAQYSPVQNSNDSSNEANEMR